MKALKKESATFTNRIVGAIANCYADSPEPTDAGLMTLYAEIGKCICTQGEKAYVVHLAQELAERFPNCKGFSPRNLRRMRDFHRTYEGSPILMKRALSLSWTQNTVILECCATNEQRSFYIRFAAERDLSKLALMKAIQSNALEAASTKQNAAEDMANPCAAVSDCSEAEAVDTTTPAEAACGAFVTACEPFRQGGGMPVEQRADNSDADSQVCGSRRKPARGRLLKRTKRSSHAVQRPPELLPKGMGGAIQDSLRMRLGKCLSASSSPPVWWRQGFTVACQCSA